ncbi:VRR-NUC domain-containing protein [Paenibacillus sp. FSL L8-0696]|uniref:VRR-NUC domain-containing protein n=1 Tax=unclassified Paenibacillus TaxID=185978 RepID=UPI0030CCE7B8
MLEREIESALGKSVKALGGLYWKFVSPGMNGVPDRIIALPGGLTVYVELKKPGEQPRPLQLKRHQELRERGHLVYVIDTLEGVHAFIQEVCIHGV